MKKLIPVLILFVCITAFDLPKGWHAAGSKPSSYEMGVDKTAGKDGKPCATIQSKDKKLPDLVH